MAGIKYQCEFYSNNGSRYRINIYHVDYSGTTIPFKAGTEGFQLTYEGSTSSSYDCIKASSLQIDFIIEEAPTSSGDPTTGNIYDDLLANNENKMFIIVQQYDSGNTAWRNFWAGDIIDDTVTIEDAPYPVRIRIKATDGIAKLKQKKYDPLTGGTWLTVLYMVQECISQTLYYSTLFPSTGGTSVITIRNTPDRYAENMGSITDSTWQDTYNPMKLCMVNEGAFVKKDGTYFTYYEILEQICTLWNCQFFLSSLWNEDLGCTWWLFSRNILYYEAGDSILTSCRVFKNQAYKTNTTALNFAEYSVPDTSVNYTPTLVKTIGDADHPKFSGNRITYLAPLQLVKGIYNHDLFSYNWNSASAGTNDIWSEIGSSRTNATSGYQYFTNTDAESGADLASPYFPDGMDYTNSPNDNNQGLFIPVTADQDTIMVTGNLTFSYWMYVDGTTAVGGVLETLMAAGLQPAFDIVGALQIRVVTSDKTGEDWYEAQYQNPPVDLGDNEEQLHLNGEFGNGENGMCGWASDNSSRIKVHMEDLPILDGSSLSVTVPFTFISEALPTTFSGSNIKTLKRVRIKIYDWDDSLVFDEGMAGLISTSAITFQGSPVIEWSDLRVTSFLSGTKAGNYVSTSIGQAANGNVDAACEMVIEPEFFIGDPPPYVTNTDGELDSINDGPVLYLSGIRIVAPASTNPTTTPPTTIADNNRRWRTQQDGTFLPLHELLSRELIKKRCFPSYKYDISFENSDPDESITFANSLKTDMKLNDGESADLQGFYPIGGTYTAVTDSWKMTIEQFSVNTTSNVTNTSYQNVNEEWFLENPNILTSPYF